MSHLPPLRFIRLAFWGLLALLCVVAVPKFASSEADTPTDQDVISSKHAKLIRQGGGYPASKSWRLFAENKDCALAKLDIWFQRGTVTHWASLSDGDLNFRTGMGPGGTKTMLIGGKDCLIRIRIEPVPAGTSLED